MKYLADLRRRLTEALKSELLITPVVELVEPHTLPVSEGKAVRIVDKRTGTGFRPPENPNHPGSRN